MPKNRLFDHWISNKNVKRGKKFFRLTFYWSVSTADQQSAPKIALHPGILFLQPAAQLYFSEKVEDKM